MNPCVLLVLEALLFALLFGGLSWLRGEGLPIRFAWEVVGITVLCMLLYTTTHASIHPVPFLLIVYLVTMRSRLLVDMGNAFLARGWPAQALWLFDLSAHLAGDPRSVALARINSGVARIQQKRLGEAVSLLQETLATLPHGRDAPRLEAACRYNLGLAYLRLEQEASAGQQFRQVIELLPNSLYARGAESALRHCKSDKPS